MPANVELGGTMTKSWYGTGAYPPNDKPNGVTFLSSINIYDPPATVTWSPHPILFV